MRAIVTGGLGFIGSHLTISLLTAGWEVTVVDDGSTWDTYPPEGVTQSVQRARLGTADLGAVFHLAGKVGPVGVLRWSGHIAKDTIDAASRAADWADEAHCPLIDVSTSEVYGPRADGLCSEDQPRVIPAGHSARMEYAVGKLAAETMLLNRAGLDVRIVRPFNVAGPGQRIDGGFVLPRFVDQAQRGEPLTVYTPGTQQRSFTHVADIVDGLLAVYERGKSAEVYNLGNPANRTTIMALAAEVIAVTGSSSKPVLVDPSDLHGPAFTEAPDKLPLARKAMTELGWHPTRSRRQIIEDMLTPSAIAA